MIVSATGALYARRQLRLADRVRQREFEATVVAELVDSAANDQGIEYRLAVTNAGPAVARAVDVALVAWTGDSLFGKRLAEAYVAPALVRGDRRIIALRLAAADARFDDREVSIELQANYIDDNGIRDERLGFVFEDSMVLTPPEPGMRP